MNDTRLHDAVATLKILSSTTRFGILRVLARAHDERREICVKEIAEAVGASHSATSHQLSRLEDRGIVTATRVGQTICYEWSDTPLAHRVLKILSQFR